MSVKFHINREGKPGRCDAKTRPCMFGSDVEHFSSLAEAESYIEQQSEKDLGVFNTMKKGKIPESASPEEVSRIKAIDALDGKPLVKNKIKADQVRVGDVISGEKFVNGRWVDDDAMVEEVSKTTKFGGGYGRQVEVTYSNGNKATYTGESPITVKRAFDAPEGREPRTMKTEFKAIVRNFQTDKELSKNDYEDALKILNDPNADGQFAYWGSKLSDILASSGDGERSAQIRLASEDLRSRTSVSTS